MDTEMEKVYVAVGNDLHDGFKTLEWTLRKWNSQPISIVILHVTCNISKDFVYTPFGKLPASSVSEEKLEVLRKYEQGKIDNLLSKYVAFCGKAKAEILKVEKYDEPIHKLIVDLISGLKITKLVVGITFMKSSSWRSKSGISSSFYVHQHKPEFCELFIICGGKLVYLRGDDEGFVEDDQGVMVGKLREKPNFKWWLGKMFPETNASPSSTVSTNSQNHWENNLQEIQNYFQLLLDDENCLEENDILESGTTTPTPDMLRGNDSSMSVAEKIESLKRKINEELETIQLKRKEAKADNERHAKAEWAICLCNERVEELESHIKEEVTNRMRLNKDLDAAKEQLYELRNDIEERKRRLSSLGELQSELSNKLQVSNLAKSHAEAQLEKAVIARAEMVQQIEELRRQRDIFQRRIEFCREKDAIGMAGKMNDLCCSCREYTADEIRLATDDFSERSRLKSGGDWTNVYRGRINHSTIAIQVLNGLSQHVFQAKVKLLSQIRHQHLVAMIGFSSEQKCIVFEYMHNGSLRDILFSSQAILRRKNRALKWHDRIRIASEVCSALNFLHLAEPKPIVHGHLTPSNILLDRNFVAKLNGLGGLSGAHNESDIRAFGMLMLNLLTGRNWAELVEEEMQMGRILDNVAGQWPLDLAEEFATTAMRCLSIKGGPNSDLNMGRVMEEVSEVRKKGDDMVARGGCEMVIDGDGDGGVNREDTSDIPSVFLCPIFQEVMKNPHVAEDGFSYELEAIESWLRRGHDTSPMTNLRLKHKLLTPNHTLRSLIHDWLHRTSTPSQ